MLRLPTWNDELFSSLLGSSRVLGGDRSRRQYNRLLYQNSVGTCIPERRLQIMFRLLAALLFLVNSAAFAQEGTPAGPNPPCTAFGAAAGSCAQGNDSRFPPQGAWTSYSPSATCAQGTGTAVCTANGIWQQVTPKTTAVQFTVTVSGTFTVGSISTVTLPNTSATVSSTRWKLFCTEDGSTNFVWDGSVSSGSTTAFLANYLGSSTVVTGYLIYCSGLYENS